MVKLPLDPPVTVSETDVVCVTPPPVPVTVIVYEPVAVVDATVIVIVEEPEPGAGMDDGLKPTVTPEGWPLALSAIAELKPPETLVEIEDVPLLPCTTVTELGDAEIVKLGLPAAVTVSDTEVVSTVLPDVPVTVIAYVPVAVVEATLMFMVEVPAPVMEPGLKVTVTPLGCPLADSEMVPLKPPVTVLVMVELPELPCTTVTELGEADRLNPAVPPPPARSLIKPLPFGLPKPVARSKPVVAEKPLLPLVMSWKSVL